MPSKIWTRWQEITWVRAEEYIKGQGLSSFQPPFVGGSFNYQRLLPTTCVGARGSRRHLPKLPTARFRKGPAYRESGPVLCRPPSRHPELGLVMRWGVGWAPCWLGMALGGDQVPCSSSGVSPGRNPRILVGPRERLKRTCLAWK